MSLIARNLLLLKNLSNLSRIKPDLSQNFSKLKISPSPVALISTSSPRRDLMEFFDDPKNWGKNEVRHGRAWTKDELRIKSSADLHKLWFVLLKERNMLLTMEHEYNDKFEYWPSPERIDKVKISMANLEEVVKERNKAYYELETGAPGVRIEEEVPTPLGIKVPYKPREHLIPKMANEEWRKSQKYSGAAVYKFLKLYREREYNKKKKERNRNRNHVMHLLRRFPDMDLNLLKEKYPDVDIDKLLKDDKIRPHV